MRFANFFPDTFPDTLPEPEQDNQANRATEGGGASSSHENPERATSLTQNFEEQIDMELVGPHSTLLD